MTTYARCTADITVAAYNIRTAAGHKARQDQSIQAGETLPVARQYIDRGLVFHGDTILVLTRGDYQLHVHARDFEISSDRQEDSEG